MRRSLSEDPSIPRSNSCPQVFQDSEVLSAPKPLMICVGKSSANGLQETQCQTEWFKVRETGALPLGLRPFDRRQTEPPLDELALGCIHCPGCQAGVVRILRRRGREMPVA